jgi:hypothetical protein
MKRYQLTDLASQNRKWVRKSYLDTEPPLEKRMPTGPFQTIQDKSDVSLLLFVPRNEIGRTINSLTGRYGYSHLAIDCGEIDIPTGRRVMIEATVGPGVHYAFEDEYGKRPFLRIPLQNVGMDVNQFCECVHSNVGEKFDDLEVITLGVLDNPARQLCSDVATVCLPEGLREKIARRHKGKVLHPLSAVRDEMHDTGLRLFVSPNGYAEFFGTPRGQELKELGQIAQPRIEEDSNEDLLPTLWKLGDTVMTSAWKMVTRR